MSEKLNSKCAKCRAAGEKLMLKGEKCIGSKCPFAKRSYPPGDHGPDKKRRGKISGYGRQLMEKQKVKRMYGLMEKQFSAVVAEAESRTGDTGKILVSILESRLDNIVYRAGFARSRMSARQMVTHGLVTVDGKKLDVPSARIKVGAIISIKESAKKKKGLEGLSERLAKVELPSWLSVDANALSIKVLNTPALENPNFNVPAIIEFYSR